MKTTAARMLAGLIAAVAMLALTATAASAATTVTPTLSLTEPGGSQAGSTAPLTTDIKLSYSASQDSVKNLTLSLPPGLLANAAIDGGQCLKTTTLTSACQVATGTVTAAAYITTIPVTQNVPVSLDLVPPPKGGDLAGLQIVANDPPLASGPLGTPGDVVVNSPDAHVTISFTNIPDSVSVLGIQTPISVQELQTSLSGMRLPTACSGLPPFVVTVGTYDGAAGGTSQPLKVTGCSHLALTPSFAVTAVKDAADNGVQVTTDLRQPQPTTAPFQASARSVVLTLPPNVLGPNVLGALKVICPTLSSRCSPIGTATSTSPLYPTALTGQAYLVGQLTSPQIAIVFPPPFSLSLAGAVNIVTGSTTFTGVPDLPLSDLEVVLSGGPNAVFSPSCNPSSGTAGAALTSQNGDETATATAPFTVAGCTSSGGGGGSTGGGGGSIGGGGGNHPGGGGTHGFKRGHPRVMNASFTHLGSGQPVLRFRVVQGNHAPKVRVVVIQLPRSMGFRRGRSHGHALTVVHLGGARLRRAYLDHGFLVIVLARPVSAVSVQVRGIVETATITRKARHHRLHLLHLGVGVVDASRASTVLRVVVRSLHL